MERAIAFTVCVVNIDSVELSPLYALNSEAAYKTLQETVKVLHVKQEKSRQNHPYAMNNWWQRRRRNNDPYF